MDPVRYALIVAVVFSFVALVLSVRREIKGGQNTYTVTEDPNGIGNFDAPRGSLAFDLNSDAIWVKENRTQWRLLHRKDEKRVPLGFQVVKNPNGEIFAAVGSVVSNMDRSESWVNVDGASHWAPMGPAIETCPNPDEAKHIAENLSGNVPG